MFAGPFGTVRRTRRYDHRHQHHFDRAPVRSRGFPAARNLAGAAGHFWLQHLELPADIFGRQREQELLLLHGYTTWNNFLSKCVLRLTFVGDLGFPALLVCTLLAVLLGLPLWSAFRPVSKVPLKPP